MTECPMATGKQAHALAIKLSRERRTGKEVPPPPKDATQNEPESEPSAISRLDARARDSKQGDGPEANATM